MTDDAGKDQDLLPEKGNDDERSPRDITTHTGNLAAVNDWGLTFDQITLRHRRGNDPGLQEEWTFTNIEPGSSMSGMDFTYETGVGSPYDYWWVKFTAGGEIWQCKDNFYCSVASGDDGSVWIYLNGDSQSLTVEFSESPGCRTALFRP